MCAYSYKRKIEPVKNNKNTGNKNFFKPVKEKKQETHTHTNTLLKKETPRNIRHSHTRVKGLPGMKHQVKFRSKAAPASARRHSTQGSNVGGADSSLLPETA